MKKIFLFCAAVLVALAANAEVKNIEPGTDKLTNALKSAADGDVLVLAAGTYTESTDYIVFDKNVEVKAAEGAKPQIDVVNYIKVSGEKTVKIQGLKFNGEAQGSRDQYIRIYAGENNIEVIDCEFDAIKKNIFRCEASNKFASLKVKNCKFNNSASNVMSLESALCGDIEFDGCEFTWGTAVPIHFKATAHAEKLKVNNCYFHDGKRAAVFFEDPSPAAALCDSVFVTNSTFAKIENTDDYWVSIIDIRNGKSQTKLGYALVDHCTFYDCKTINTDHVAVRIHKSTDATVSNCIFWDPNQKADEDGTKRAATNLYGGDVKNCIAYNYLHGTEGHIHNGATYTACSQADPLFADAANGDYTISVISPAFKAGTDGKHLGDPRWWPEPIADGYYLIYSEWKLDDLGGKFEKNPKKETEYMLNVDLTLGYGIKVCKVVNEVITDYYPDGMGNEYIVDADHAGKKCIYFDGTTHSGWLAGEYIWIDEWVATGINNVEAAEKAVKMIENGQLIIIKNGVKFNAQGTIVR